MDRLRRSLRDSFRKKKDHVPECSKPHQWQADEAAVRAGTCCFPVKYLGCVEVYESRGMQVCEEALKMLRNSRRRPVKGILYVTGDGLRVVDEDTKGLIVDQTIEKVSFCAPDRNHEKGFSYICRDGTTRRWMCHGFLAMKDSGERLSHAVGCAFAACLERKQKRDKECGVTMTFDPKDNTFTRMGSFRQTTLTERMQDPQDCKPVDAPPLKSVTNPFAIARPHATPMMLQRQGSFRGFVQLNQASSPFKRQLSLRLNDLPSNLERQQRSMSLESSDFSKPSSPGDESPPRSSSSSIFSSSTLTAINNAGFMADDVAGSPEMSPRAPRNRLHSLPNVVNMSPIPESSPVGEARPAPGVIGNGCAGDSISVMCQQLSRGLTLLSSTDDPFAGTAVTTTILSSSSSSSSSAATERQPFGPTPPVVSSAGLARNGTVEPVRERNPWAESSAAAADGEVGLSRAETWLASSVPLRSASIVVANGNSVIKSTSNPLDLFASDVNTRVSSSSAIGATPPTASVPPPPVLAPRRAPHLAHLRSQSLGAPASVAQRWNAQQKQQQQRPHPTISTGWSPALMNGNGGNTPSAAVQRHHPHHPHHHQGSLRDPFDAEWAAIAVRTQPSTNPFAQNSVKAFEVHM